VEREFGSLILQPSPSVTVEIPSPRTSRSG
jgi:hypothetical protein